MLLPWSSFVWLSQFQTLPNFQAVRLPMVFCCFKACFGRARDRQMQLASMVTQAKTKSKKQCPLPAFKTTF